MRVYWFQSPTGPQEGTEKRFLITQCALEFTRSRYKFRHTNGFDDHSMIGNLFGEVAGLVSTQTLVNIEGKQLSYEIAASDANAHGKTLFATHLWQGSLVLARHLITKEKNAVKGAMVVELGAGAGVPSMVAMSLGASKVLATDFPAPEVLATLRRNLTRHASSLERQGAFRVMPLEWGSREVFRLLAFTEEASFDVALVAECLWKHYQHSAILHSLHSLLRKGGVAFVAYSHHIPNLEAADDSFFTLAESSAFGFRVESSTHSYTVPSQWNDVIETTIFVVKMVKL